jgi:hypothetical protein
LRRLKPTKDEVVAPVEEEEEEEETSLVKLFYLLVFSFILISTACLPGLETPLK